MSFDIIVLRPQERLASLSEMTAATKVLPLGSHEEIRMTCGQVFPGVNWSPPRFGLYASSDGYSLEFSIPDDATPTSLHLCLHFGASWNDEVDDCFAALMGSLYERTGWQAFAVSDSSSLLPAST